MALISFATTKLPPIAATTGRLIRLGPAGLWARHAIDTDTIRFGVPTEPHDLCFAGDWGAVRASLIQSGELPGRATELTGQLRAFYTLGPDALWVARFEGLLWWGFAEPEVIDQRGGGGEMGVVARHIRGGWSCRNVKGGELLIAELGPEFGVLKSSPALCNLEELGAFCRIINAQ